MKPTGHGSNVGPDGKSALPPGIVDMASLGSEAIVDAEVQAQLEEIFRGLEDQSPELNARFRLELALTEKRSRDYAFGGMISAWTNGGFAHGGGDEAVYFCANTVEDAKRGGTRDCGTALDLKFISNRVAVCPGCRRTSKPKDLTGQIFARLPTQHWATLLLRYFRVLEHNADIRIGVLRGDLHAATNREQTYHRGGDDLRATRTQREWVIYPLKNIIKDTAAGADLYTRLHAFLMA